MGLDQMLESWKTILITALVLVGIIGFAIVFANYVTARQDQHREEFKQQCVQQGGQPVDLRYDTYCLINGEKIEF